MTTVSTAAVPAQTAPADAALEQLAAAVVGVVLEGGDPAVAEEVATFNVAVQHRPSVVVGATCAADVVAAVRYARAAGRPVVVQSTGHGPVRAADGAVMVTTKRMQGLWVDPAARTARVEAGVRWRDVIDAAAPHGLAPLNGSSSQVGVVGYTLGGGLGLLARKHGFAADHVRSVELVTADGDVLHVDAEHHAELFWALRGGKGSFGIVTALEIDLVEASLVHAGPVFFAGEDAAQVLHAYRTWAPTLPEEATTSIAVLRLPPLPELPEPLRGQTVVHLRWTWLGDHAEGDRLLAPMLASGRVLLGGAGPMPYTAIDAVHQDPTDPMPVWERGALLSELTAETVDALLAAAGPKVDVPLVFVELRQLGGAIGREPAVPNAVAGRDAAYAAFVLGPMLPGLEEVVPAVGGGVLQALAPWTTPGALLNFLGDATTPEQVATAWSADVHARLLEVKDAYDPANLFRSGHALR